MTATTHAAATSQSSRYTVDEVAERTQTTVRTIRWYQSEGLLPAPTRAGRVAMYDDDHVARLDAIRELQTHGLTLAAIRRLLERSPTSAGGTALAFVRTAVAHSVGESADVVSLDELGDRLGLDPGTPADPAIIRELGIAHELPDGRWRITSPAVFEASVALAELGVPVEARIQLSRTFAEHTRTMAEAVVAMFVEYLLPPGAPSGVDPATWEELSAWVARLRPLSATAVASAFDVALANAAERTAERMFADDQDRDDAGDANSDRDDARA